MPDFLNVGNILQELDLKEDMIGAEFGCGSANFAIILAKKLKKGKVYALDIQEEKLSALNGKLAKEKIDNVYTILCDLEAKNGSTLVNNYLDLVLIPNVLFQAENKHAIIEEAKRILKPGGQILIIDWLPASAQGFGMAKKSSSFSPKEGLANPLEVKKIAKDLGLILKKEFATGDYHYALIFIKPR